MTNANTPPGDALSESELSEIEARAAELETLGSYDGERYEELQVEPMLRDLRRLVDALRRARAENEALRSAMQRFIVGDVVRISDNSKIGIVELISERYGAFVRTDTSALWIDFGLLKRVDAAEKPPTAPAFHVGQRVQVNRSTFEGTIDSLTEADVTVLSDGGTRITVPLIVLEAVD